MKPSSRRCKCLHCKGLFVPDYRNRGRQQYCSSADCRQASKRSSQQQWLSQAANRDYFRGPENVKRVQQWRAAHPDYWKQRPPSPASALQETCPAQAVVSKEIASSPPHQPSLPAPRRSRRLGPLSGAGHRRRCAGTQLLLGRHPGSFAQTRSGGVVTCAPTTHRRRSARLARTLHAGLVVALTDERELGNQPVGSRTQCGRDIGPGVERRNP